MPEVDLEPGALAWITRVNEISATLPGLASRDLGELRAASTTLANTLAQEFTAPAPEDVAIDEFEVEAGGRMLRLRRYVPEGISSPRPTQVFLHGGGFIKGSPRELQNDRLLATRARGAGIQILSLQYALAPEHPYPVARDQLIELLRTLTATPELADLDAARLGVGGNSAGAGVVATAVLKWCADGGAPLAHQLLEVPPATVRDFGESFELYGRGFGLDDIDQLTALILPEGAADEYASALDYARRRETPIDGYPRTLVMTAEYDPLRDTAEEFARELQRIGAPVAVIRGARQLHGGSALTAATDGARLWQRRAIDELSAAYATVTATASATATAGQPASSITT